MKNDENDYRAMSWGPDPSYVGSPEQLHHFEQDRLRKEALARVDREAVAAFVIGFGCDPARVAYYLENFRTDDMIWSLQQMCHRVVDGMYWSSEGRRKLGRKYTFEQFKREVMDVPNLAEMFIDFKREPYCPK